MRNIDKENIYINGLGFYEKSPQQLEKKNIILQYNVILFSMIIYVFIGTMLERELIFVMSAFGVNIPTTTMGVAENAIGIFEITTIIKCVVSTIIPIIIISMFNYRSLSLKNIFALPKVSNAVYCTLIMLGVMVIAMVATDFFSLSVNNAGVFLASQRAVVDKSFASFFLLALYSMLIKPFFDELLFRGIILSSLRKYGDFIAIVVSTILYTAVSQRFDMVIFNALMGLGFAYFAVKSNSFITTFIASAVVNMYLFLENIDGLGIDMYEYVDIVFVLITFISIITFTKYIISEKNAFIISMEDTALTNRTKLNLVLTNFCFWSLIVLCIVKAVGSIQFIGQFN